ncbi:kremen protein 1-like [Ptychodera flava]|uniref:kremen protein 1-like n=1 Tax=Ptychodera flava TaxID=63121 RepID=UPI00396A66FC
MALQIPKYDVTIQGCIKECRNRGKSIAVLQSADECYCGDDSVDYWRYGEAIPGLPILPNTSAVKYNTLQCSGDNDTTAFMQGCGGDWQLDVYNTSFGACGGDYTDSSGYIYSPNFPGNYTNEQSCTWTITVDPGHIVKLATLKLRLQDNDMVIVKDGIEDHSSTISTFTGYSLPQPLYSSSNTLRVEMVTDDAGNDLGFALQYEADEITVSTPVQQSTQMTSATTKGPTVTMTPGRQSTSAVSVTVLTTNEMTSLTAQILRLEC